MDDTSAAFDRLYDRLVGRGERRRKKAPGADFSLALPPPPSHLPEAPTRAPARESENVIDLTIDDEDDEEVEAEEAGGEQDQEAQPLSETTRLALRNLRIARNLVDFARVCGFPSSMELVAAIVSSPVRARQLLMHFGKYRRHRRPHTNRLRVRQKMWKDARIGARMTRVERIAARLFKRSIAGFEKAENERCRPLGDLVFFSPPAFQSRISYSKPTPNAVPLPPSLDHKR